MKVSQLKEQVRSILRERSVKAIQKDYSNVVSDMEKHLELYKKSKGTPEEKKHIGHLKTLTQKKKSLQKELDLAVANLYKNAELKVEESVNEDIEPQTKKIASLTGTRPDAVKQFVSTHGLNITKLLKFIEKGKLSDRMDFVSSISGKPGNPIQKRMIKMFQESVIREDIKKDIDKFIDKLNKQFPDQEYTISSGGGKYVRINHKNRKFGSGESAWGFISLVDNPTKGFKKGDLLKAAGYNTPAKHARGNILNGDAKYDKYSPTYLKEEINEESYKVAGRPVTLIKGKKSDATDWKVKFQNGKETSLSDVLALIKPFPKGVHWRYKNLESVNEGKLQFKNLKKGDILVGKFPPYKEMEVISSTDKSAKVKSSKGGVVDMYSTNNYELKETSMKLSKLLKENTEPEIITQLRDIVKKKQYQDVKDPSSGKKMKVDMQTANTVLKIYDGLSNVNKQNMAKMSLPKMIDVSYKIVGKYK
jgi:hypothetical protein